MNNREATIKLRIKFAKYGAMRFVGHLDMMRYFQKAIRRAKLDAAYTGGFSPHQIMSFAAPLGVGLTSKGEYMDIEVYSCTTSEEMKHCLNQVMTQGMEIISVRMLDDHSVNAMASVAAAVYTVAFKPDTEPLTDWVSQFMKFIKKESIPVIKKTKKSEMTLDLKTFIYSCETTENGVRIMADASSSGNMKPGLIMRAFFEEYGILLDEFALVINREDTYTDLGTAQNHQFVPLEAVGKEF